MNVLLWSTQTPIISRAPGPRFRLCDLPGVICLTGLLVGLFSISTGGISVNGKNRKRSERVKQIKAMLRNPVLLDLIFFRVGIQSELLNGILYRESELAGSARLSFSRRCKNLALFTTYIAKNSMIRTEVS